MPTLASVNPATGEKLGVVPILGEAEVKLAVQNARVAQKEWGVLSFRQRARFVMAARRIVFEQLDDIALLISKENGKPLMEAVSHDILPVMDLMTFFSKKAKKLLHKESIPLGKWNLLGHQSYLEYEPYGVVGVISPWNFPFSIPMGGVVMALLAGNTVVLKPSEYTPMVGLKIGKIFEKVGLPKHVLQIVTGDGSTGQALVTAGCDKIAFTGSVATGKRIMAEAAKTLTPVSLELGGKDPLIVLPDADLDLASSAAVWGAFCNSGQVCASVERVYVHESVEEPFTKMVVEKTKKLRQGSGESPEVEVGSMTAEMQIHKVEAQLKEAREKGAVILTGGAKGSEHFFPPTVIKNVDRNFSIVKDETFGPVLPIMTFRTEAEVVTMANDSDYALNAYVWTGDIGRGKKIASQIVAGTVNINDSVFTHALAQTPWGGPKESGIGRTHGALGLLDLVRVRHVHINRMASKQNNFWWYTYSAEKLALIKALCFVLFGRPLEKIKGVFRFVKLFFKVKTI